MDLKELCERIDLAPEIQSEVLGADLRIPDELTARLISTDTADEAYGEIEKLCDPEKHGFVGMSMIGDSDSKKYKETIL